MKIKEVTNSLYPKLALSLFKQRITAEELLVSLSKSNDYVRLKNNDVKVNKDILVATLQGMYGLVEQMDKGAIKHYMNKGLFIQI
jgi:hypothetical protein